MCATFKDDKTKCLTLKFNPVPAVLSTKKGKRERERKKILKWKVLGWFGKKNPWRGWIGEGNRKNVLTVKRTIEGDVKEAINAFLSETW